MPIRGYGADMTTLRRAAHWAWPTTARRRPPHTWVDALWVFTIRLGIYGVLGCLYWVAWWNVTR